MLYFLITSVCYPPLFVPVSTEDKLWWQGKSAPETQAWTEAKKYTRICTQCMDLMHAAWPRPQYTACLLHGTVDVIYLMGLLFLHPVWMDVSHWCRDYSNSLWLYSNRTESCTMFPTWLSVLLWRTMIRSHCHPSTSELRDLCQLMYLPPAPACCSILPTTDSRMTFFCNTFDVVLCTLY